RIDTWRRDGPRGAAGRRRHARDRGRRTAGGEAMRKAWLSVAGVCAVALLAIQFAWQGDAPVARALDESSVPMAAPATSGDALPAASEPEPALLLGPDVPVEFRGAPGAVSGT